MKPRLLVILNLSLVSGCAMLGVSIFSPVLPEYALSFSIPVALVGWAISAFALAPALLVFVVGVLMICAKDPARRRSVKEYPVE